MRERETAEGTRNEKYLSGGEEEEEEEEKKAWYDVSVEISWNQTQSFHVLSGSNARWNDAHGGGP